MKIRLLNVLVWPVATYGRESWVINKADEQRIQAFEMKGLRQILAVSWTAIKTNDLVLEKAGVTATLFRRRKLRYFGHVIRNPENCLEKDITQGSLPENRRKGRPQISWLDDLTTWTSLNEEQCIRKVEDRQRLRRMVHSVANSRSEDGWREREREREREF